MQQDDQSLTDKIKHLLASNSQFRNPQFDPAPFLIQILKQKESDQQAILQRQKQLIQLQNQAFQLIDEISAQYSDHFFKLLDVPQRQGQQLQKLKSNMSVVKKKVKQTKSLLQATQKDIDQTYLNCIYNKTIYKKLKQIDLKLFQFESASLALKNNQFLNCSLNLPSFQGQSVLQSALSSKFQNLKLQLLSRGIQQVTLFLYITPKIVLPTSQSLIQRISGQQSYLGNLKKHQSFHKRYNLFKKAYCLDYLPTLWSFKQLQKKQGKIHLIYDIIQGVLNIGKIQQIIESLQIDSKKSINSIFLLLQYFFSIDLEQERKKTSNQPNFNNFNNQKTNEGWFLCRKNSSHTTFISCVLDIMGVIIRKLIIVRLILNQYQVFPEDSSSLNIYNFMSILLKQLSQIMQDIYITKQQANSYNFIKQQIIKKIKSKQNYIYWGGIKNMLIKSIVIIDQNISMIESQLNLTAGNNRVISKPKWEEVLNIDGLDKIFYNNFHEDFSKTLVEIFNHQGRSFAFQSLEEITSSKLMNEKQTSFCKFFSSQQIKYSKQFVYTISFLGSIQVFFSQSNFSKIKSIKYKLFLLSVLYLKLNYYVQRNFINSKSLQRANQIRKTNNKLRTKQKDFKRQYDKIVMNKKFQISIKPWKRSSNQQIEPSKYRLIQNLKGIQKQNQMLFSYCVKYKQIKDLQRYKQSQKVIANITVFDKLQPANYDQNFNSKLIKIWDQLPELQQSIFQHVLALFQKFIELHMVIVAVIYEESANQ